jgi:hypothetical protein
MEVVLLGGVANQADHRVAAFGQQPAEQQPDLSMPSRDRYLHVLLPSTFAPP